MERMGWKSAARHVSLLLLLFAASTSAQTYVQSQTAAVGSGGNNSATFPSQPTAGNTVVVGLICYGPSNCTLNSLTDNFSNTYTKIGPSVIYGGPTQNVTNVWLYCASSISSGSSFTVSAALSNTGGDSNLYIAEYSGLSCNVDQSATGSDPDGSNSSTVLQTSSLTTTNANDLLVAVAGSSTGGAATAGSGYHLRQNGNNGVAENGGFEDQVVTTTGSYSGSMTLAGNTSYWAMLMVALKGAAGAAPTVTGFTPISGPIGTSVTITGTNFTGATAVKFSGTAASVFTVNSSTQITATVPPTATSGPISVTTPAGTGTSTGSFTVTSSSGAITYVQSQTAALGSSGNNSATFSASPAAGNTIVAGVVCYGPNDCSVSSITDNFGNSYAQIGPTALYGNPPTNVTRVLLYCASGITSGSNFHVTAALSNGSGGDSNIYIAEYSGATCTVDQSASGSMTDGTPTTLLQTSSATTTNPADLLVAVAGSTTGGAATVGSGYVLRQNGNSGIAEFGGFEDRIVSATGSYNASMTFASSTSYWGMVMAALKGSSAGGTAPTVTSFSPTSGCAGTTVTITGTNLTGTTAVAFNATAATSFTVNSSTQITATVPSAAISGPISVTTPSGTGSSAGSFTISCAAPVITSLSPSSGVGGSSFTINGSFGSAPGSVLFGSTNAAITWGTNSIIAQVPSTLAPGVYDVQVVTASGSSNTKPFTIVASGCPTGF